MTEMSVYEPLEMWTWWKEAKKSIAYDAVPYTTYLSTRKQK